MLKQLLCSLQQFARKKENEVKKGFCTREFATSLIQSYASSMIKALIIINRAAYTRKIQFEADKLCVRIHTDYQSKFKLRRNRKQTTLSKVHSTPHRPLQRKSLV